MSPSAAALHAAAGVTKAVGVHGLVHTGRLVHASLTQFARRMEATGPGAVGESPMDYEVPSIFQVHVHRKARESERSEYRNPSGPILSQ